MTRNIVNVLGTAKSLDGSRGVLIPRTDGHKDLSDANASNLALGLSVRVAHTGLETIGTGAGKHFVDTDNVVRVDAHAEVETVFAAVLDEGLVGSDTGSLKSLRRQLLTLVRDQVNHHREFHHGSLLGTDIVNAELGVWSKQQKSTKNSISNFTSTHKEKEEGRMGKQREGTVANIELSTP